MKYYFENVELNKEKMMDVVCVMLELVGEDLEREGLLKIFKWVVEVM